MLASEDVVAAAKHKPEEKKCCIC